MFKEFYILTGKFLRLLSVYNRNYNSLIKKFSIKLNYENSLSY